MGVAPLCYGLLREKSKSWIYDDLSISETVATEYNTLYVQHHLQGY